jgi:hypothetical protein
MTHSKNYKNIDIPQMVVVKEEQLAISRPALFDWQYYLEKYPDLRKNGVQTEEQALTHWNTCGEKEGRVSIRTPAFFDWKYYLDMYPDLRKNGVKTEQQALVHWHSMGEKEGRVAIRTPYLFDWQYYLEKYPDLRKNGVKTEQQAISHWLTFGEKENRTAQAQQTQSQPVQSQAKQTQAQPVQTQAQPVQAQAQPVQVIDLFAPTFIENIAVALAAILKDCDLVVNLHIRNIENADIIKCKAEWGRFLFICCPQKLLQATNGAGYPTGLNPLPENKYFLYQLDICNAVNMNPHIIRLIKDSKHTFDYAEANLSYYPKDVLEKVSYLAPRVVDFSETLSEKKYDILCSGYTLAFIQLKLLTYTINENVTLINNRYLNKRIDTNIDQDGTPIRNIKTFNELIILYKKNSLPYYINSLEAFYILYPDFDLNYYKQKYYKQTTLSDIKIMYDFHTINEYKKRLYNDKIKIVIYTAQLYEKCGGIKALHSLAQKINNLNHKRVYAKLYCYDGSRYVNNYCNDFANPFEINENTIVIYPEIITGNPLNAKYVVRWILLELGIEMKKTHYLNWNKTDIVYHWEPTSAKTIQQLALPFLDKQFKNVNNSKRTKTCFLIKKGPLIHNNIKYFHPTDAVQIDNMSLNDVVKIFNESHTFYCYDPNSFYLISATVCGCISVIYPIKNISSEIYFKNRITYIDNFVFNSGIAYGNSTEQLTHARNTLSDVDKNINMLLEKYETTVSKFTEDMYDYLTQDKQLITIEKEYY